MPDLRRPSAASWRRNREKIGRWVVHPGSMDAASERAKGDVAFGGGKVERGTRFELATADGIQPCLRVRPADDVLA